MGQEGKAQLRADADPFQAGLGGGPGLVDRVEVVGIAGQPLGLQLAGLGGEPGFHGVMDEATLQMRTLVTLMLAL